VQFTVETVVCPTDNGDIICPTELGDIICPTETGDIVCSTETGDIVCSIETDAFKMPVFFFFFLNCQTQLIYLLLPDFRMSLYLFIN
jgi:hypothetical protein